MMDLEQNIERLEREVAWMETHNFYTLWRFWVWIAIPALIASRAMGYVLAGPLLLPAAFVISGGWSVLFTGRVLRASMISDLGETE